ncbi:MAG TPA: coproporphyrinogen III oxidase family protein [Thiotrichales bacterium]|nr:coproporphyrinogen III oxidase family protein [Thiotrichales bacterium]
MKHYSDCFNKRSKFVSGFEVRDGNEGELTEASGKDLAQRLAKLLKIQNDFFPCFDWSFPPPILDKAAPPDTAVELFSHPSVIPGRYSIYLHIPFCQSLCSFCYYAVIPRKGSDLAEDYVRALAVEMSMYRDALRGRVCESVYIGGGTPTFLDGTLLQKVFRALRVNFDIEPGAEITVEAAPGTLSRDKLELLHSLGVNRLSYGIQTLDEKLLATMNRDYSVAVAEREIADAIEVIGNVNVDTMYGFDGEAEDTLLRTLTRLHELGVPSVSIYALDKQRSQKLDALEPPRDELYEFKIRQFARAEELLASFGMYPVLQNIFVDPERASYWHQLRRWDNLPLVGLGINAQGYAPRRPYQNIASIKSYCEVLDEGRLPVSVMDELDEEMDLCRELTSKLRFTCVSLDELRYKYGVDVRAVFADLIEALESLGYVEEREGMLRMTPKAAYYNNIIPMLFSPDSFKEKLLGLPEEYIEAFPVPQVLTRVGKVQSAPFVFEGGRPDRRVRPDRRQRGGPELPAGMERRRLAGRRSSDRFGMGSIAAGVGPL